MTSLSGDPPGRPDSLEQAQMGCLEAAYAFEEGDAAAASAQIRAVGALAVGSRPVGALAAGGEGEEVGGEDEEQARGLQLAPPAGRLEAMVVPGDARAIVAPPGSASDCAGATHDCQGLASSSRGSIYQVTLGLESRSEWFEAHPIFAYANIEAIVRMTSTSKPHYDALSRTSQRLRLLITTRQRRLNDLLTGKHLMYFARNFHPHKKCGSQSCPCCRFRNEEFWGSCPVCLSIWADKRIIARMEQRGSA